MILHLEEPGRCELRMIGQFVEAVEPRDGNVELVAGREPFVRRARFQRIAHSAVEFLNVLVARDAVGGDGDDVSAPDRMAPVNALLDVAPAPLREALLIAFLDRLSR